MSYWTPALHEKQSVLFNMGIEDDAKRLHSACPPAILVCGPRKTGKTLGVCHRVCRHLWEVPGARVALISKTIRTMTDGGIWQDLLEIVMPEWIRSGIGFEYTTIGSDKVPGPVRDSVTRTIFFKVRNMHGGESELRLISIEHDFEVKAKLKNTRFSMIWFSELSLFEDPNIFRVSMNQLRMVHLEPWQHIWIADTNPSEKGEDHWAFDFWYRRSLGKNFQQFSDSIKLLEIFLDENTFLTEDEKNFQRSLYSDDPGEYAREVEGKWVKGHGTRGKHFADVFSRNTHVIGGGKEEGDMIDVDKDSSRLFTGWDLGEVNHAAVALDKRVFLRNGHEVAVWCVLDDLLYLQEQMTIQEFAVEFFDKMKAIEARAGKKFDWQHWSDDSALNMFRPTGATFDYLEVQQATNGEIILSGVAQPKGSVKTRVRIIRKLLREKRLFVSSRCNAVIEMLENLEEGETQKDYVKWGKWKHMFDALSYPIFMESADELINLQHSPVASPDSGQRLVSVPLA